MDTWHVRCLFVLRILILGIVFWGHALTLPTSIVILRLRWTNRMLLLIITMLWISWSSVASHRSFICIRRKWIEVRVSTSLWCSSSWSKSFTQNFFMILALTYGVNFLLICLVCLGVFRILIIISAFLRNVVIKILAVVLTKLSFICSCLIYHFLTHEHIVRLRLHIRLLILWAKPCTSILRIEPWNLECLWSSIFCHLSIIWCRIRRCGTSISLFYRCYFVHSWFGFVRWKVEFLLVNIWIVIVSCSILLHLFLLILWCAWIWLSMILIEYWLFLIWLLSIVCHVFIIIWDWYFNVGIVFLLHLTHLYFLTQLLHFWTFTFIVWNSTNWLIKVILTLVLVLILSSFILKRWITLLISLLTVTSRLFLHMLLTSLHYCKVIVLNIVATLASLLHLRHSDSLDHGAVLLVEDKFFSSLRLVV